MIKYIKGDLLDFPAGINVIFHQANTEAVMGAGIAKIIKQKYPSAYKSDREFPLALGESRLGHFSYHEFDQKKIINLYGQMLRQKSVFGIATDYLALYAALARACNWLSTRGEGLTLGFPYGMGCGLGGGEWEIVEEIIRRSTKNHSVYIVRKS